MKNKKNRNNKRNRKKNKLMLPITSYWIILAYISIIVGFVGELFQKNNKVTLSIAFAGAYICVLCMAFNRAHGIVTFNPFVDLKKK